MITVAAAPATADQTALYWMSQADRFLTAARESSDGLGRAIALTQQLYQRSSNDLSISRQALVNDIHATSISLNSIAISTWPDLSAIDEALAELASVKKTGGFVDPTLSSKIAEASTALQQIAAGGKLATDFANTLSALSSAVNAMSSLAPPNCTFADAPGHLAAGPVCDSLEISEDVQCHSVFGGNDAKLTLQVSQTVAFPSASSSQSQSQAQSIDLGTMTCSPPITFSAGVAFSSIREQEFGIAAVSSGKTTANQFVLTSDSTFKPIPMAFAHARLWESPEGAYGFHFSFGIGANIRGQNSGGSDAEYLVGGSLSLWHIAYITSGVHLGSQVSLADGYTVGSAVPANVTQPPLRTGRAEGFGFAISFGTSPK